MFAAPARACFHPCAATTRSPPCERGRGRACPGSGDGRARPVPPSATDPRCRARRRGGGCGSSRCQGESPDRLGPSPGRELIEVVDPERLFQLRHLRDDAFEALFAEQLVLLVLELLTQRFELL